MSLGATELQNIATLSRLATDDAQSSAYAKDISKILTMMDILSDVNTDDIKPLTNVHDGVQTLRADVADGKIDRDAYQMVAPAIQDGLYLVPQVIE